MGNKYTPLFTSNKKCSNILKNVGTTLMLSLLISGCGENTEDLKRFTTEQREKVKGRVEKLPDIKTYKEHAYNPSSLSDPFNSSIFDPEEPAIIEVSEENGIQPDPNRPREVLEKYDLDSLRMVGILEQNDTTWALIKSPDGTIHRVKHGNYLGRNHGRITAITSTQINLIEIVPDGLKRYVEREATVALSE